MQHARRDPRKKFPFFRRPRRRPADQAQRLREMANLERAKLTERERHERREAALTLAGLVLFGVLVLVTGRMDYDAAMTERAAFHGGR